MKIKDLGHCYSVDVYPHDGQSVTNSEFTFQFIKRIGERFPGNTGEPRDGTNCQELLRVLIDRCIYLNKQIPCDETERIIEHLRIALMLFERRAERIKGYEPMVFEYPVEKIQPCKLCGHIYQHQH